MLCNRYAFAQQWLINYYVIDEELGSAKLSKRVRTVGEGLGCLGTGVQGYGGFDYLGLQERSIWSIWNWS